MIENKELSALLVESLGLETPPVCLNFVQAPPEGVRRFEGEVPSACAFWRLGEGGRFYADASAHFNCPIGAHTMGVPMTPEKGQELMGLIEQMGSVEYFEASEVPHVPTVPGTKSGIVYGPLAESPDSPEVVLLWATPQQAMLLQEAAGTAKWSADSGIPTFGRPSCAAIPAAMGSGVAALSLGCMGMRVFTEISQDRLLAVLPQGILADLPAGLRRVRASNEQMTQHYRGQRAIHTHIETEPTQQSTIRS